MMCYFVERDVGIGMVVSGESGESERKSREANGEQRTTIK